MTYFKIYNFRSYKNLFENNIEKCHAIVCAYNFFKQNFEKILNFLKQNDVYYEIYIHKSGEIIYVILPDLEQAKNLPNNFEYKYFELKEFYFPNIKDKAIKIEVNNLEDLETSKASILYNL